jgi:hypothetical protein
MYKNVIEPGSVEVLSNPTQNFSTKFLANILALHLKIGWSYIPISNFPAVDVYAELGVRAYNNFIVDYPPNYPQSYGATGMFGRSLGKGVLPSGSLGVGIGLGKWKK